MSRRTLPLSFASAVLIALVFAILVILRVSGGRATLFPIGGCSATIPANQTLTLGANIRGTGTVNQELSPDDFTENSVSWENLGTTYTINGTSLTVRVTAEGNEFVMADAIRIESAN